MRIKYLFLYAFIVLFSSVLILSCTKDDEVEKDMEVTFSDGKNDFIIEPGGGTIRLSFSSSQNSEIKLILDSEEEEWCHLSTTSVKKGDNIIEIIVDPNENEVSRKITFNIGENPSFGEKLIHITQRGKGYIKFNDYYEVATEGQTIYTTIKSNVDYDIIVPEEYQEWVRVASISGTSLNKNLQIAVNANTGYEQRIAEVFVVGKDIEKRIVIQQAGEGYVLVWGKKHVDVGSDGSEIDLSIKSNLNYNIMMPNVDWIEKVEGTRTVTTNTIRFNIKSNESFSNRSAEIIVCDYATSIKDTVIITQSQNDAIIISSEKNKTFFEDGGYFDVELNTNISYDVKINCDWISETTTSSKLRRVLALNKHTFKVTPSDKKEEGRVGFVIFSNGVIADTIVVKQIGSFYFSERIIDVDEHQTTKITLTNNTNCNNVEWKSTNDEIATVDNDGIVSALKSGEVSIIAKTADGEHSDTCQLKIAKDTDGIDNFKFSSKCAMMAGLDRTYTLTNNNKYLEAKITHIYIEPEIVLGYNSGKVYRYDLLDEDKNVLLKPGESMSFETKAPDLKEAGWVQNDEIVVHITMQINGETQTKIFKTPYILL